MASALYGNGAGRSDEGRSLEEFAIDYIRDGAEIYRRSFATIRAEADLAALPADVAQVAVRMIHACGMVDLVGDLACSRGVVAAARAALRTGAPILCDAKMVAAGVTRSRLPAGNDVVCTLRDPRVPELARRLGTTRSAAALELWRDRLDGAVVAIGNAPTALFRLLEMLDAGAAGRPAAVLGSRSGSSAPRSRRTRWPSTVTGLAYLVVHGRRGGSAHGRRGRQRARERGRVNDIMSETGHLYGVGPRARRPRAHHGQGRPPHPRRRRDRLPLRPPRPLDRPRASPTRYLRGDQIEEALVYPVTTETTDHPGGYQGAIDEFYAAAAERLAAHLDAGRDVVVLAEGDPLFYGSYMHMHKRLAHRYPTEVVPGVTSVSAASAASRAAAGRARRGAHRPARHPAGRAELAPRGSPTPTPRRPEARPHVRPRARGAGATPAA